MKFKIGFFWVLNCWPKTPAIQVPSKVPKFQQATCYLP